MRHSILALLLAAVLLPAILIGYGAIQAKPLYILMYHHLVPDGTTCNDWTVTESHFRADLQWLSDHGYTSIFPSQLVSGEPLPKKPVLITFDDGYASNYQLALPILQEFQTKAVISIITRRIDEEKTDFLTWDMCRSLAQSGLIEFGSHTHDAHSAQTRGILRLKGETQEEYESRIFPDILTSIRLIRENIGTDPMFFAYPHGQTDPWADSFIDEHFPVSVTTLHGAADLRQGLGQMRRHNISMDHPVWTYLP